MGGDLEIFTQTVGKWKNVQRWGRNDNLLNVASVPQRNEGRDSAITGIGVDISIVDNFDDGLLLFPGGRVHLEISSDKELARHSSDYRRGFGRVVRVRIGR